MDSKILKDEFKIIYISDFDLITENEERKEMFFNVECIYGKVENRYHLFQQQEDCTNLNKIYRPTLLENIIHKLNELIEEVENCPDYNISLELVNNLSNYRQMAKELYEKLPINKTIQKKKKQHRENIYKVKKLFTNSKIYKPNFKKTVIIDGETFKILDGKGCETLLENIQNYYNTEWKNKLKTYDPKYFNNKLRIDGHLPSDYIICEDDVSIMKKLLIRLKFTDPENMDIEQTIDHERIPEIIKQINNLVQEKKMILSVKDWKKFNEEAIRLKIIPKEEAFTEAQQKYIKSTIKDMEKIKSAVKETEDQLEKTHITGSDTN